MYKENYIYKFCSLRVAYLSPNNFNYWWNFGSIALIILFLQIIVNTCYNVRFLFISLKIRLNDFKVWVSMSSFENKYGKLGYIWYTLSAVLIRIIARFFLSSKLVLEIEKKEKKFYFESNALINGFWHCESYLIKNGFIKRKRNLKKSFKYANKRFYRTSQLNFGPDKIKKMFKVIEVTTNVLSRGFTKKQLKEISVENKEEVMKSIVHKQNEIEGMFKINNGNEEHTAFVGITHSHKHDVKDDMNLPIILESWEVENKLFVGPEFRLINNKDINKNKLYNKIDNSNLNQYQQSMEDKINEMYEKEGKISYINGIKDNKINHAVVIKTEKNGKIVFNLNDINTNHLTKIEKIDKID